VVVSEELDLPLMSRMRTPTTHPHGSSCFAKGYTLISVRIMVLSMDDTCKLNLLPEYSYEQSDTPGILRSPVFATTLRPHTTFSPKFSKAQGVVTKAERRVRADSSTANLTPLLSASIMLPSNLPLSPDCACSCFMSTAS